MKNIIDSIKACTYKMHTSYYFTLYDVIFWTIREDIKSKIGSIRSIISSSIVKRLK